MSCCNTPNCSGRHVMPACRDTLESCVLERITVAHANADPKSSGGTKTLQTNKRINTQGS